MFYSTSFMLKIKILEEEEKEEREEEENAYILSLIMIEL